jgi:hypothetical protein
MTIYVPDTSPAIKMPLPRVVLMRFGEHCDVALSIRSDRTLSSSVWSQIGYAARQIESLAETIDEAFTSTDGDEFGA